MCCYIYLYSSEQCSWFSLYEKYSVSYGSYSREEPFTVLNIDIRNQQNLLESLEQYVKGDLLEGANAYHCEKCNKKVCLCVSVIYSNQLEHSIKSSITSINCDSVTLTFTQAVDPQ